MRRGSALHIQIKWRSETKWMILSKGKSKVREGERIREGGKDEKEEDDNGLEAC